MIEYNGIYDELTEDEIKKLWVESYDKLDQRTLNMTFLASLKHFFGEKGLDLSPLLKQIFQVFNNRDKAVSVDYESSYWQLLSMIFAGLYLESGFED